MQQERIEIQLPSRLWYIEPVLSLLKQLAQQLGFCQQRVADIQLAIDEICGNAIEHGSAGDDTGIAISFVLNEHQLDILVRDKGTDNKGNWLTAEKLNEIYQKRAPDRERGHGIYMVEQLSDELKMEPKRMFELSSAFQTINCVRGTQILPTHHPVRIQVTV